MTPNRAEATCLIELFLESPFGNGMNRSGSSPPSPVLLFAPMRFIAIASVSCASLLIEPNDMAPVVKRLTISLAGSTSSSGIGASAKLEIQQAAQVGRAAALVVHELWRTPANVLGSFARVACCSL